MEKKLKLFEEYSSQIRKSSKSILEYNVLEGYDRQITKLEKYGKYNLAFRQEIEKLYSQKNNSLKLLENDELLKFYLDDEVRKIIMKILIAISSRPNSHIKDIKKSIESLKNMGFSDAEEYLMEFSSVEDIRKDLFEKAGLEFKSFDELLVALFDAHGIGDIRAMKKVELLLEKNGIVHNQYDSLGFNIEEILMMPWDSIMLFNNNSEGMKK